MMITLHGMIGSNGLMMHSAILPAPEFAVNLTRKLMMASGAQKPNNQSSINQ